MNKKIWKQCGSKRRFKNEHMANLEKKRCEELRGKKLDYYWCSHCNGYHLTSQVEVKLDYLAEFELLATAN